MRKSYIRFTLVGACAFVMVGQASAQANVSFWINSFGDPAANQPAAINVVSGSTAKLSVYVKTSGIGSLNGITVLFGYSSSTTGGGSATAADTKATFNSFSWAQGDLTSNEIFSGQGGGNGPAAGTSRPYGLFASTGSINSSFAGSGDGINFRVLDVTLNINAAAGNTIPISVWSFAATDNYASAVLNSNNAEFYPSQPYNATLNVTGVPEPASIAILGLGGLALLRRRRNGK